MQKGEADGNFENPYSLLSGREFYILGHGGIICGIERESRNSDQWIQYDVQGRESAV